MRDKEAFEAHYKKMDSLINVRDFMQDIIKSSILVAAGRIDILVVSNAFLAIIHMIYVHYHRDSDARNHQI